ncbi:hypothetical protein ACIA8O_35360 [Kitasatospora sp. NPDC051853]|uniref:hypothetical protein n=1 Tax=Kitasatospora sp. NPDC051853 TaxID=3364058 RepID=UPI0037AEDD7F
MGERSVVRRLGAEGLFALVLLVPGAAAVALGVWITGDYDQSWYPLVVALFAGLPFSWEGGQRRPAGVLAGLTGAAVFVAVLQGVQAFRLGSGPYELVGTVLGVWLSLIVVQWVFRALTTEEEGPGRWFGFAALGRRRAGWAFGGLALAVVSAVAAVNWWSVRYDARIDEVYRQRLVIIDSHWQGAEARWLLGVEDARAENRRICEAVLAEWSFDGALDPEVFLRKCATGEDTPYPPYPDEE